jgi:hypothetical protein
VDLLIWYKRRRRGQPSKGVGWRAVGLTRFWKFSPMWIMSITHTRPQLSERNKNCLESGKLLSACTLYSSSSSFSSAIKTSNQNYQQQTTYVLGLCAASRHHWR